jgi:hypothetical protein
MEGVTAVNGGELIGINTNLGDKVSDRNVSTKYAILIVSDRLPTPTTVTPRPSARATTVATRPTANVSLPRLASARFPCRVDIALAASVYSLLSLAFWNLRLLIGYHFPCHVYY